MSQGEGDGDRLRVPSPRNLLGRPQESDEFVDDVKLLD
jgi:hypothetical protein